MLGMSQICKICVSPEVVVANELRLADFSADSETDFDLRQQLDIQVVTVVNAIVQIDHFRVTVRI